MPPSSFESQSETFLTWFKSLDGVSLSPKISLHDFSSENAGRGVIAVQDIEEDEVLFSIPKEAVLSVETSKLYTKIPSMGEMADWPALILTMLHESSTNESFWKSYFNILPFTFDTPMFWNEEELEWLRGSSVCSHIGKDQAEQDWHMTVKPIIESFPDLFHSSTSIHDYHRMGSLILAYSFGIDTPEDDASEVSSDSDNDEKKAMVPMADMLNADPRYNNARIFYTPVSLEMKSTAFIAKGEQVWNTYGERPNSDLLRSYGYIAGSESDVCEIKSDVVVNTAGQRLGNMERKKRVDLMIEEDGSMPKDMIVVVKCLQLNMDSFNMLHTGAVISATPTTDAMKVIRTILEIRMHEFPTTIETDQKILLHGSLSRRKYLALHLRKGEKQVLLQTLEKVKVWLKDQLLQNRPSKKSRSA